VLNAINCIWRAPKSELAGDKPPSNGPVYMWHAPYYLYYDYGMSLRNCLFNCIYMQQFAKMCSSKHCV